MATWINFCRTEQGKALDAKLMSREEPLKITKAMSGAESVNPLLLSSLKELPSPRQTLMLSDKLFTDDPTEFILPIMLQNKGLTESYKMYILAIYAEDPDLGEIIYMVCQTTTEGGEEIPSEKAQPAFSIQWNHVIKTDDASKVTVEVPEAGLLTENVAEQRYAKIENVQNMVFDGAEAPLDSSVTKLWIDTGNDNVLKYYNGSQWVPLTAAGGGFVVSDTAPEDTGVLWIDTAKGGIMKYYNGTAWAIVAAAWG